MIFLEVIMQVAVVGAGSWGTALAKLLGEKGHDVVLWGRSPEQLAAISARRENARYLPDVNLPATVSTEPDLAKAVAGCRFVVSVLPSHAVRAVLTLAAPTISEEAVVISASKGIENDTLETMDEVLREVLPAPIGSRLAVLSGPSFARDVAMGLPTAVVMASKDPHTAATAAELFHTGPFRVYTSDDVTGVELGGALKNVMAIAAGILDGMRLGLNSRAALITRGLAEISRLAVCKGANPLTLAGLAGIGDLVLTCTGDLSRNRTVGLRLGEGKPVAEVLAGMKQVAEGVKTTKSAHDLARRLQVDMPITEAVYRVLYENVPTHEATLGLLDRAPKRELG
jgi:glycerol-3-phosphate dehydrogenase (NAD(P)+)